MHKHETKAPAERRKKTRSEKTREVKSREIAKQQAQQSSRLCWSDVASLHADCEGMLLLPTRIAPVIRNKEITDKVTNRSELARLSAILLKDVREYQGQLAQIRSMWQGKSGAADSPDDLLNAIMIGEKYENWNASYQTVVIDNLLNILDIINTVLPPEQQIRV
jgi:hypothetical protein